MNLVNFYENSSPNGSMLFQNFDCRRGNYNLQCPFDYC